MSQAAGVQTGIADVNGARLYYEVSGSGHPLVLIHAGIADSRMWEDQAPAFAERYRVMRYDVRGFGRSDMPEAPFSHADDLLALFELLGLERAHVLGCSMGGGIAIDFTLQHPDRVDALILVAPALGGGTPSEETLRKWREVEAAEEAGDVTKAVDLEVRMWVDGPRRTPDQVSASVREHVRQMDAELFERPAVEAEERELEPPAIGRLGEIQAPTLVVVGDVDVEDILKNCDALVREIPGARNVVIPNTAHVPNMEKPQEFNRVVLDFLDRLG